MLELLFFPGIIDSHFLLTRFSVAFTVTEQPISLHPHEQIDTIPLIFFISIILN